jgi:hypothetical protein
MPDSVTAGSVTAGSVVPDSDFELGRSALLEITSAESIGAPAGSIDEGDGVTTLYFETLLSGYPGWRWTVSIAHVGATPASVLETELTPGDDALLSPAWVPWVDRLADYTAAQDTAVEDDETNDELDDDDTDDDDTDDDDESDDTDDDESDDDDDDLSDDDDDDLSDDDDDDLSDDDDDDGELGSDVLHGGDLDGVDIDESDDDESDDDELDDEESDDDPEDEHERSV